MRLGKHISALLHDHKNVTVPGLGTFTRHYLPAKFIPEKKVVEPPRKIADFSAEPSAGNTPLIAYMAEKEGVTEEEITRFLGDVVREIHMTLDAGKTVELENLGHIRKKADGELQFKANPDVNYLAETPGGDAIKTPEQQTTDKVPGSKSPRRMSKASTTDDKQQTAGEEPADKIQHTAYTDEPDSDTHQQSDTQNQTTMTNQEKKKKMPAALRWLMIIGIPFLVIAVVLLLNFNYFFGEEGWVSNWRIFNPEQEEVTVTPDEEPDEALAEVDEEVTEPDIPDPAEKDTTEDLLTPEPGRPVYYLVVGSFRNRENAHKQVRELEAIGADRASLFEKTPSDYHRVSYGFFYDLEEARNHKENLPEELRTVAWILHR